MSWKRWASCGRGKKIVYTRWHPGLGVDIHKQSSLVTDKFNLQITFFPSTILSHNSTQLSVKLILIHPFPANYPYPGIIPFRQKRHPGPGPGITSFWSEKSAAQKVSMDQCGNGSLFSTRSADSSSLALSQARRWIGVSVASPATAWSQTIGITTPAFLLIPEQIVRGSDKRGGFDNSFQMVEFHCAFSRIKEYAAEDSIHIQKQFNLRQTG